jgi:hypothetical protein
MSVPFPFTSNGVGAGFGIVTIKHVEGVEYAFIDQSSQAHSMVGWFVDVRLQRDANTFAAILSALHECCGGKTVHVSLSGVPLNFELSGASCGLAGYFAVKGVVTKVAISGYIQSFGSSAPSLPVHAVDSVDQKIMLALHSKMPLIVPSSSDSRVLRTLEQRRQLTTYAGLQQGNGIHTIGSVQCVCDAAFVLCAMDRSVPLSIFDPLVSVRK